VWPWRAFDLLFVQKVLTSRKDNTLSLHNPTPRFPGEPGLMTNISAGVHVLLPGDSAPPHRHTSNALRIVLQGSGVTTLVDGKPCAMSEGDLVMLPGWSWHEHAHHGTEPVVWLELLDVPLHEHLRTVGYEPGPIQALPRTLDDAAFAAPSMVPHVPWAAPRHSPVFLYPWRAAAAAVSAAPLDEGGVRRVKYVNPLTGGPAMAMLEAQAVQIEAGTETRPFRTSADLVCVVLEGSGTTRVGEKALAWGPRDIVTLPHGQWFHHTISDRAARLLVVSDADLLRRLDLLTEEYMESRS
jgi:gentisate 1,2-dioxygenase